MISQMKNEMTKCDGCKYDKSTDIVIHLEFCTHCERAYTSEKDREYHEDLYEKANNSR